LKPPVLPNCSATAVEKGNTVLDPTMRIWSRASAWPARASKARAATERVRVLFICRGLRLLQLGIGLVFPTAHPVKAILDRASRLYRPTKLEILHQDYSFMTIAML
jgi:hypothetical protein